MFGGGVFAVSFLLLLFPLVAIPIWACVRLVMYIRAHRRPPVVSLVLLGLGGVMLVARMILSLLANYANLHLYLFGRGLYYWDNYLLAGILVLLSLGGLIFAVGRVCSLKTLTLGVLLCGFLFFSIMVFWFSRYDTRYTEVVSPAQAGEAHELVFEEKSWLFAGETAVYERVSPCFMKKLGDYPCHDGSPNVDFCDFAWRADGFTMSSGSFSQDFAYISDGG